MKLYDIRISIGHGCIVKRVNYWKLNRLIKELRAYRTNDHGMHRVIHSTLRIMDGRKVVREVRF